IRILVGTGDGLHEFADGGRAGPVHHAGRNVTALAPGPDYSELWAILDEAEVWRTAGPGGWARSGTLEGEHLRANCIADTRPGVRGGRPRAGGQRGSRGIVGDQDRGPPRRVLPGRRSERRHGPRFRFDGPERRPERAVPGRRPWRRVRTLPQRTAGVVRRQH